MRFEYQYKDSNERQIIIESNLDKFLTEEKNIKEGNFLIFTDVKPLELEIEELKQRTEDVELMLTDLLLGGV